MNSNEIRKTFLEFFEKRGHKIVPSSSLVPKDDPSVLFTTAGMQQFKLYYIGKKDAKKDFGTLNTVSSQKSLRTSDIGEVGDESHLTFFEMLGNFSFGYKPGEPRSPKGGYFKKEAIEYAYEFITKEMKLEIDHVSIFRGDDDVSEDKESYEVWKSIGIPEDKIKKFGREDNFWGPTGDEGPCGPTTEIYVDGVEIWNIVFNEYYCKNDGTLEPLEQKGVDTGMGLERLAVVIQGKDSVFETDLFESLMNNIKELSRVDDERARRIVADHIKASVFLIGDGVVPSNTEQGYILRRLIRRAIGYANNLSIESKTLSPLIDVVVEIYADVYPELQKEKEKTKEIFVEEEDKFLKTLHSGSKELTHLVTQAKDKGIPITGKDLFFVYSTHGYPLENSFEIIEEIVLSQLHMKLESEFYDKEKIQSEFDKEMKKHQEVSKAGADKKFKGGLAGHSEMEIKYHSATHLLHQALREVLGNHVLQKGSNITSERLRFDFSHSEKMTDEEKKDVEDLVNEKIKESLPVSFEEVSLEEAKDMGALGAFDEKYEDKVRVYFICPSTDAQDDAFSIEICGGPHVENTSELGYFKIKKEESVSAGVRRIKAILE